MLLRSIAMRLLSSASERELSLLGHVYRIAGLQEEAVRSFERAMRIADRGPSESRVARMRARCRLVSCGEYAAG